MADKRVWVVFTDQTDLPWIRVLKRGFRHCFVLIYDGRHWVSVDPMAHCTDVTVHDVPEGFDLPAWLAGQGHIVVSARLGREVRRAAPWMMFTCVEACKRVLGIRRRFIFTPWQFYNYLKS